MITRENGAMVLTDKDGTRHAYYFNDPIFGALDIILSKQVGAANTNAMTRKNYNDLIANLQISVDNGKPQVQPPKPLMDVVDDQGNESQADFAPPLNDLRPAKPSTPAPGSGSGATVIPVGTGGLTADEQRQMYNMIKMLFHDKFPTAG